MPGVALAAIEAMSFVVARLATPGADVVLAVAGVHAALSCPEPASGYCPENTVVLVQADFAVRLESRLQAVHVDALLESASMSKLGGVLPGAYSVACFQCVLKR